MGKKPINLTNQRFGRLLILGINKKENNSIYWDAICDCGNKKIIRTGDLTTGKTKSCGCLKKEANANKFRLKLEGQQFGKLTVIDHAYNRKLVTFWNVVCSCGTKKVVCGRDLISKSIVSCGCIKKEIASKRIIPLENKQFGQLFVIKQLESLGEIEWLCQCSCGKFLNVKGLYLRNGKKTSCGCKKDISKGEFKIKNYLEENKFLFETQYRIKECKYKHTLSFDFCVNHNNNRFLIEYQGEQHYRPIDLFGGELSFSENKIRDKIKEEYCNKNNIPLLLIPYWRVDDIPTILNTYLN